MYFLNELLMSLRTMLETPKLYKNTLSWPKNFTYCSAFKSFLCAKHFFNGKWMILETPKLDENTLSWLKPFTYCSAFKSFLYAFFFSNEGYFHSRSFQNYSRSSGKIQGLFKDRANHAFYGGSKQATTKFSLSVLT